MLYFQRLYFAFLVCLAAGLGAIAPSSVLAQTVTPDAGLHLTISPPVLNLVAEPGKSIPFEMRVQNIGNQTESLTLGVMKFSANDKYGRPKLSEREKGDDYFDWLSFSPKVFDVAPNEWKTVNATLTIPKTAAFGYYYAVTFTRAQDKTTNETDSNTVHGSPAVLVLLEARVPNAKRLIQVVNFSTDKKVYDFLPVNFNLELNNLGNVHVAPSGNIFIDRGKVKDIGIVEINPNKGTVLPNSPRVFSATWSDGFPVYVNKTDSNKIVLDAKGKPVKQLKWDFAQASKIRIGHYSAHMLLVYDDGKHDIPIEAVTSFWVLPWKIIGLIAIVVLLILVGLFSFFRGIWRAMRRKRNAPL